MLSVNPKLASDLTPEQRRGKVIRRAVLGTGAALAIASLAASPLQAQSKFAFEGTFGYTGLGGDYGKVLSGGWVAEFNIDYHLHAFRYGIGYEVGSFDAEKPFENESVSKVGAHLYATYLIQVGGKIKPFITGRIGSLRLRPEGETFAPEPEPLSAEEETDEEGENPAPRVDGFEGAIIGGVEFALSSRFAFDVSGLFSTMSTDEVDLTAIGYGTVDKGTSWSLRVAARWRP
jgi:hypothetical protein